MAKMPKKRLTDKQERFVQLASRGVPVSVAARDAGYTSPSLDAQRNLALPHIQEELRRRRDQLIQGDLARMALTAMQDLITSEDTPASVRYQASKDILDRAGHKVRDEQPGLGGKALAEMTGDELMQTINSGMQALNEIAKGLDGSHIVEGEARTIEDINPDEDESFLD